MIFGTTLIVTAVQFKMPCSVMFQLKVEDVLPVKPVLFGDFLNPNSDTKLYNYVEDYSKVRAWLRANVDISTAD